MDILEAHKTATKKANAKVPTYELNTPEHEAWLRAFDISFIEALEEQDNRKSEIIAKGRSE